MIEPKEFVSALADYGIDFFAGVPDSLLMDFCAYVDDHGKLGQHVICANEGNAVAMACGYHMATRKCAVVYLQNSGLGNSINPITSIVDKEVYKIPMLLVIGWRGEPGFIDEPQHVKQGRITPAQLDLLEIPYQTVDSNSDPLALVKWSRETLDGSNGPVALLVKKGTFSTYKSQRIIKNGTTMNREAALEVLLELTGDAAIISTTGKTSREVFELRVTRKEDQRDFLTVGGMGHTASIALGVAIGLPEKRVVCIDGDGSLLMHLGALPIIGSLQTANFTHILLNNASHESVGGQPTVANRVDFRAIALASGYNAYAVASNPNEIRDAWKVLQDTRGPVMLEIKLTTGSRKNLGRPSSSPVENKRAFMDWLN
jgi:phosphonopyruvate decarboxylase